jgi:predicted transcriptional regulator
MKRTTIMVEEDLLYKLQQIAHRQERSTASVIREALVDYVTTQHAAAPPRNPLLALASLGESETPTDVSDGQDEEILRREIDPLSGWSVANDRHR